MVSNDNVVCVSRIQKLSFQLSEANLPKVGSGFRHPNLRHTITLYAQIQIHRPDTNGSELCDNISWKTDLLDTTRANMDAVRSLVTSVYCICP